MKVIYFKCIHLRWSRPFRNLYILLQQAGWRAIQVQGTESRHWWRGVAKLNSASVLQAARHAFTQPRSMFLLDPVGRLRDAQPTVGGAVRALPVRGDRAGDHSVGQGPAQQG